MTDSLDPKTNVAREVLKVLCAEPTLDMPVDKIYRKTCLNIEAVDEFLEQIEAAGLVDLNEGWIRMSRSILLEALCAELSRRSS